MITVIKDQIAARLDGYPAFAGRVHIDRERPFAESDLPCANVRFIDAEADNTVAGQIDWLGNFTVTVTAMSPEPDRPDAEVERLTEIARKRIAAAENLVVTALRADHDVEGEVVCRAIVIELAAGWTEEVGELPDDLADLNIVHVDIDMAQPRNDPQHPPGPDGQIDAQTTIELPPP